MRVFVAGAGGAIGRRLVPQLVARGHDVVATTTSDDKTGALRALGAQAIVMDGLDAGSVGEAVGRTEPEAVVHQMTALAGSLALRRFDEAFALTNDLRTKGTDHLLAAADAVGVPRFVAQSFAGWPNARSGGPVKSEQEELDPCPPRAQRKTLAAIRYLERTVVDDGGVVLRYGNLYGPCGRCRSRSPTGCWAASRRPRTSSRTPSPDRHHHPLRRDQRPAGDDVLRPGRPPDQHRDDRRRGGGRPDRPVDHQPGQTPPPRAARRRRGIAARAQRTARVN
jgi:nucleoside-diphosphate-sugar epimerase